MVKKIVFDFDGTLIRVNSFPKWVKFLLWRNIINFKLLSFIELCYLIFLRKILNQISHNELKQKLILTYSDSELCVEFAKKLKFELNQNVLNRLKTHVENNDIVVISSAAAEVYLKPFFEIILDKQPIIIGSQVIDNKLITNHKETKIQNLELQNFIEKNENFDCLYTDSLDDFSIAERADKVILVNPDMKSKAFYFKNFADKTDLFLPK